VPALFVVTDPSSLWVQIDARESDLSLFEAQPQTALPFELSVAALPGQTFKAQVISSGDFVDPQSRTIKVRAIVANPDRKLKADMLATARFERHFAQGVMVPATAVMLRTGQHSVFVQTRAAEFERRSVKVVYEGPKEVILSSGLQAGEQVVVENALLLNRLLTLAQASQPSATPTEPKPPQAKAVP
jgi:cobalt-zinc-cadmium efflux system membrane fusion protein